MLIHSYRYHDRGPTSTRATARDVINMLEEESGGTATSLWARYVQVLGPGYTQGALRISIDFPSCIIDPQPGSHAVAGRPERWEAATLPRCCLSSTSVLGDLKRTEPRRLLAGAAPHGSKFSDLFVQEKTDRRTW